MRLCRTDRVVIARQDHHIDPVWEPLKQPRKLSVLVEQILDCQMALLARVDSDPINSIAAQNEILHCPSQGVRPKPLDHLLPLWGEEGLAPYVDVR